MKPKQLNQENIIAPGNIQEQSCHFKERNERPYNLFIGEAKAIIKGVRRFLSDRKEINVCEIGCRDGHNLVALHEWGAKENIGLRTIGIDKSSKMTGIAKKKMSGNQNSEWITDDYNDIALPNRPDVIFSSLYSTHSVENDCVQQLHWMYANSKLGFFIVELEPNRFLDTSSRIVTTLSINSRYIRNNFSNISPKGLNNGKWEHHLKKAGITDYTIYRKLPFYRLITVRKGSVIKDSMDLFGALSDLSLS